MRLAEDKIQQAIIHPEEEVRLTALRYWSHCYGMDDTIMPQVIKSVETFGHGTAFSILRDADRLPQTSTTIDWLIAELGLPYDLRDVQEDNYRYALALILLKADPELLVKRHSEIVALPMFPDELKRALDERLKMHFWDFPTTWTAFEDFSRQVMRKKAYTKQNQWRSERFIKALAHHRESGTEVLKILRDEFEPKKRGLFEWMEPEIVRLAGEMRLAEAIPVFDRCLVEGYDAVLSEIGMALGKIGTDVVVDFVVEKWTDADSDRRFLFVETLEKLHTDHCAQTCLEFLEDEEDMEVALFLGHAALSHFCFEAIEPVRKLVLGDEDDLDPEQNDLRCNLVAAATIMNVRFSGYEAWHEEAVASNYGWWSHEHDRLSENFGADE